MPDTATENVLIELAKEACAAHSNPEAAAQIIVDRLESDDELFEQVRPEIVRVAALEMVYRQRRTSFLSLKATMANPCPRGAAEIAAAGDAVVTALLDSWRMPWGGFLGDCTGKQLLPLSASEMEQARGHAHLASWYAAIADKAGERRVRDVLSNEQVATLWKNAAAGDLCIRETHLSNVVPDASKPGGNGHHEVDNQGVIARPAMKQRRNGHAPPALHGSTAVSAQTIGPPVRHQVEGVQA